MDYKELSLNLHEKHKGKLAIVSKVPINNKDDLSTAYTPGVAEPCLRINKNKDDVYKYTLKGNTIAVITDGSAVLGLGNIGPEAAIPVMEGKAVLFKRFANLDAFPICLKTQDTEEIINIIKNLEPVFGGINLEDISAPRCFEIEERLKKELSIPVMHDDQHGTAVVVLAGLINACKVAKKEINKAKVTICGAGAAGTAVAKLLLAYGIKDIIVVDSKGIISRGREDLNQAKKSLAMLTNPSSLKGSLENALKQRDVFIGLSTKNLLSSGMVRTMNSPIIFAMANPDPEIMPEDAKKGGAVIIATGRSDYPNQINNVLAFPGIFKGALSAKKKQITDEMKLRAAEALASLVNNPSPEKIIPAPFDPGVVDAVAKAVASCEL
ncbi:MAG TPA: NADP-dependent malic enzyme [Candidatus Nanoarchaeia archaeon]|nr:NADP-dependent malic enzyme [Candidatus Nanoarchaeia archaeon]